MPTQVPNSGYVENIYFNTNLTDEEVSSLLSSLPYNDNNMYTILLASNDKIDIEVTKVTDNEFFIADFVTLTVYYHNVTGGESEYGFIGWNPNLINPIEINEEVLDGGAENDKLTNIISITPFEEPIALKPFLEGIADAIREKKKTTELINAQNFRSEILSIKGGLIEVSELPEVGEEDVVYKLLGSAEGTTVPSGKLTNIYFNNNLTTEEVLSIIESANLSYSTDGLIPNSYLIAQCLMIIKNENDYGIMYIHSDGEGSADFNNIEAIFSSANAEGVDFVGWNPNFKNPIEYEYDNTVESNDTAISKNEALKDLVSSTPFSGESDYYIYEGDEPTQVPNSGWIENLYFNTKLSVEETDAILSQLTFSDDGDYIIMIYQNVDETYGSIGILEANKTTQGQITSGYMIFSLPNASSGVSSMEVIYTSSEDIVAFAESVGLSATVGWNKDNLSVSQEAIDDGNGLENDKLINVVSTTPYPHWTKISGGGATVKATPEVVPNSGYVERVYFNKSLSFDEVNAIVEKANSLVVNELVPIYCIVSNDTFDKQLSTFKLTDHDGTTFNSIHYPTLGNVIWSERDYYNEEKDGSITQFKKGWMFEEDYVEINGEVVSFIEGDFAVNVGQHNDQLTELFSANGTFVSEMKLDGEYDGTTIFLSNKIVSEPTVVPNSGTVEKVYFNTELSVEEVVSLISGLIYYTVENQPITYSILASSDWLHTLNITNENGNYTILKYNRETNDLTIIWTNYEYSGDNLSGWREVAKNAISFECEVTNTGGTFDVGAENDKITSLVSITPFEAKTANNFNIDIKSMLEEKKLPLAINVNVEPNLQEKEITENGEYVADEGYDGFSKVTVNVGGSSEDRLKKLLDARQSANYLFHGFKGKSVDDLISYSDTENVTDMNSMFSNCTVLQTIPQLDTSKAINMGYMFYNCYKLTAVSQLDTSKVTNAQNMFYDCNVLTEIPQLNTSKVTIMNDMFSNCYALETISQLDLIRISSDYNVRNFILNCKALTNLTLLNIKVYLTIGSGDGTGSWDWGHLLTLESLINTVKELINVDSARTLTMGTANLEKIANTYVKFTDTSQTTIPINEKGDVVVCDSTDTGAMLLSDYALLKNWTLA